MVDGITLKIDDTRILATFDDLPRAVRSALLVKCTIYSVLLEAKIKGKLSGDVLNVVTGNLRRSIFSRVWIDGDVIHAEAGSSGDVKYARFWELGFHGIEHVRGFTRVKDQIARQVRPFDRHVDQDPRPFIRPSLDEMSDDIVAGLKETVAEAIAR